MKLKLIFLILIYVAVQNFEPLLAQDQLPDTLWSKKISGIHVLKFSPDGKYVFAGVKQNILKIDVINGEITNEFYGYSGTVKRIEFSPSGDTIICSGGVGGAGIALFNDNTLDTIYTTSLGSSDNGADAYITPDGKRIITTTGLRGMDKPSVLIIDIATKTIIKEFIGRYNSAHNLRVSPDGRYFCFTDYRGLRAYLVLIDLNTFEEIEIFGETKLNGRLVGVGEFSADGTKFLTSADSSFIWDLKTMKIVDYMTFDGFFNEGISSPERRIYGNFKYYIMAKCFQEDYSINKIIIWNIENDSQYYEYDYPGDKALDISPDGYIASFGVRTKDLGWGEQLTMIRPSWKETNVIDPVENNINYTIHEGLLKIEFKKILIDKPIINIYDIQGKLIGNKNNFNFLPGMNTVNLDIAYLLNGVYFIEVIYESKSLKFKVLKH